MCAWIARLCYIFDMLFDRMRGKKNFIEFDESGRGQQKKMSNQ